MATATSFQPQEAGSLNFPQNKMQDRDANVTLNADILAFMTSFHAVGKYDAVDLLVENETFF